MYYLGIDWATDKHDVCLLADDGRVLSEFEITHDLKGFELLHQVLKMSLLLFYFPHTQVYQN